MSDVYVVVKNPDAKELNTQPWLEVRQYKIERRTDNAVILKCGKTFPKDRCFETYEEARLSASSYLEPRGFGDTHEPKLQGNVWV